MGSHCAEKRAENNIFPLSKLWRRSRFTVKAFSVAVFASLSLFVVNFFCSLFLFQFALFARSSLSGINLNFNSPRKEIDNTTKCKKVNSSCESIKFNWKWIILTRKTVEWALLSLRKSRPHLSSARTLRQISWRLVGNENLIKYWKTCARLRISCESLIMLVAGWENLNCIFMRRSRLLFFHSRHRWLIIKADLAVAPSVRLSIPSPTSTLRLDLESWYADDAIALQTNVIIRFSFACPTRNVFELPQTTCNSSLIWVFFTSAYLLSVLLVCMCTVRRATLAVRLTFLCNFLWGFEAPFEMWLWEFLWKPKVRLFKGNSKLCRVMHNWTAALTSASELCSKKSLKLFHSISTELSSLTKKLNKKCNPTIMSSTAKSTSTLSDRLHLYIKKIAVQLNISICFPLSSYHCTPHLSVRLTSSWLSTSVPDKLLLYA